MANVTITAASVVPGSDAELDILYAGAAITAGAACMKDGSNLAQLADANDTAKDEFYAIAASTGVLNQPFVLIKKGSITIGGTLVAGTEYFLSRTPGAICPFADLTTGDKVIRIGYASTAAILILDPKNLDIILA